MIKRGIKYTWILIVVFTILSMSGCEDYFEYSPYASNVKSSFKDIDDRNIADLSMTDTVTKEFITFAVIADSHYSYHELNEAVININNRDVDFVIANGDISDHGYLKEFELFHEHMNKLLVPYFTVIGNHDYRSNGEDVYREMYGSFNKSFVYNNNFFILFDNVELESGNKPDLTWLENQLKMSSQYDHVFVLCHLPPYAFELSDEFEEKYKELMNSYGVDLSIHGHIHRNEYGDYYEDGMMYLSVESIMDKQYSIIMVSNSEITAENIRY